MVQTRAKIVLAEPFGARGQELLRDAGAQIVSCVGADREALTTALQDADALIVRSATRVDRALLQEAPKLRVVGRAGAGVDSIDVSAATEAGILVLNTPAANSIAAAEHTFTLLLAFMRKVCAANASVRAGLWNRQAFVGNELFGKTLGVVSLGRIGAAVAARAQAFGMKVVAYDPYVPAVRAEALGVDLLDLFALLRCADIVTLHVPLTPQSKGMIDATALQAMQRHAVLVNCARGDLIEEEALLQALDDGTIAGAAIDVIAQEPPEPGSTGARLLAHRKVLATPHLGGSTQEASDRIALELARDVTDALRGHPASGAVNAPTPSGAHADRVRPFVALADRLGRLLPQLFQESMREVLLLEVAGELALTDTQPLRAALLAAILQTTTEQRVSIVNAFDVAAQTGIVLECYADTRTQPYASVLSVAAGMHRLRGTVLHAGPRVVEIDGYELDVAPQGSWIVTRHDDVPGTVGRVGTILGEAGINIAAMQVARKESDALMVLQIDRPIEPQELRRIRELRGMHRVDAAAL